MLEVWWLFNVLHQVKKVKGGGGCRSWKQTYTHLEAFDKNVENDKGIPVQKEQDSTNADLKTYGKWQVESSGVKPITDKKFLALYIKV